MSLRQLKFKPKLVSNNVKPRDTSRRAENKEERKEENVKKHQETQPPTPIKNVIGELPPSSDFNLPLPSEPKDVIKTDIKEDGDSLLSQNKDVNEPQPQSENTLPPTIKDSYGISLRQLKFKPKLQPNHKTKRGEEALCKNNQEPVKQNESESPPLKKHHVENQTVNTNELSPKTQSFNKTLLNVQTDCVDLEHNKTDNPPTECVKSLHSKSNETPRRVSIHLDNPFSKDTADNVESRNKTIDRQEPEKSIPPSGTKDISREIPIRLDNPFSKDTAENVESQKKTIDRQELEKNIPPSGTKDISKKKPFPLRQFNFKPKLHGFSTSKKLGISGINEKSDDKHHEDVGFDAKNGSSHTKANVIPPGKLKMLAKNSEFRSAITRFPNTTVPSDSSPSKSFINESIESKKDNDGKESPSSTCKKVSSSSLDSSIPTICDLTKEDTLDVHKEFSEIDEELNLVSPMVGSLAHKSKKEDRILTNEQNEDIVKNSGKPKLVQAHKHFNPTFTSKGVKISLPNFSKRKAFQLEQNNTENKVVNTMNNVKSSEDISSHPNPAVIDLAKEDIDDEYKQIQKELEIDKHLNLISLNEDSSVIRKTIQKRKKGKTSLPTTSPAKNSAIPLEGKPKAVQAHKHFKPTLTSKGVKISLPNFSKHKAFQVGESKIENKVINTTNNVKSSENISSHPNPAVKDLAKEYIENEQDQIRKELEMDKQLNMISLEEDSSISKKKTQKRKKGKPNLHTSLPAKNTAKPQEGKPKAVQADKHFKHTLTSNGVKIALPDFSKHKTCQLEENETENKVANTTTNVKSSEYISSRPNPAVKDSAKIDINNKQIQKKLETRTDKDLSMISLKGDSSISNKIARKRKKGKTSLPTAPPAKNSAISLEGKIALSKPQKVKAKIRENKVALVSPVIEASVKNNDGKEISSVQPANDLPNLNSSSASVPEASNFPKQTLEEENKDSSKANEGQKITCPHIVKKKKKKDCVTSHSPNNISFENIDCNNSSINKNSKRHKLFLHKSKAVFGSKSIRTCHQRAPFKPKLTDRSKRALFSSSYGKMSSEVKEQFAKKFKNKAPDSSKLTMMDLIFYNPSSNPMPKTDGTEKEASYDILEQITPINKGTDNNKENGSESRIIDEKDETNEASEVPVPQLKISADGKIVIAQESLTIEQSLGEISTDIELLGNNSIPKKKRKKSPKRRQGWSHEDTLKFYKALNSIGSDFETMKSVFPDRTRGNLKSKFKKEEKLHGALVDKVMTRFSEFNMDDVLEELTFKRRMTEPFRKKKVKKKEISKEDRITIKKMRKEKRKQERLSAREINSILKCDDDEDETNDDKLITTNRRKGPEEYINEIINIMKKKSIADNETKNDNNETKATPLPNNINELILENIVISTNIEYENMKYTKYISYNSNNLENPVEINETISHE